ncbi:MAG: PorP/SprF family type IX secretion system membrane protein [Bacteroidetes bacterium]|nr:PorP/SprF family type IX secretion system membrane protein [Bacteroidota bacterium]
MNHRNQWPSLPGVFLTYSFSFDKYFANFNSGVGFLVTHDRAGTGRLSNTNIGVLYSYDIKINREWHVRHGVNFIYTQRGLDFNRLIFSDQISASGNSGSSVLEVPPFDNAGDIDFSTSALLYSNKIWFGTTFDHLLKPEQSLYDQTSKVPIKVSVFGGVQVIRKGRLTKPIDESLSIAFLFKKQADFSQMDLGLYWYKNPLILGV